MSYGKDEGSITRRIDVVPRDDDAMERYGPKFEVQAVEGEVGQRALAALQDALRQGAAVEIGEGLEFIATQMPPAFGDVVGQRLTASNVRFEATQRTRPTAVSWKARLEAKTDRGEASLTLKLSQADKVPADWDDAFVGAFGGITATMLMRQRGDTGQVRWNFVYRRDASSVTAQLAALKFMSAFSGSGEVTVSDIGRGGRNSLRSETESLPEDELIEALLDFFSDVRAIEQWAGVEFELASEVEAQDARNVAMIARIIRDRGRSVSWHGVSLAVPATEVASLEDGRVMRVEHTASALVLGRTVELGRTHVELRDFKVASRQSEPDHPGYVAVRLEPKNTTAAKVFEHLERQTPKTKRPPPPPRKVRRKNKAKRGR